MSAFLDALIAPAQRCECGHAHPVYMSSRAPGFSTLNDCVFCGCEAYRPVTGYVTADVAGESGPLPQPKEESK